MNTITKIQMAEWAVHIASGMWANPKLSDESNTRVQQLKSIADDASAQVRAILREMNIEEPT